MHFAAFAAYFLVAWVGISEAARVQTNQLAKTLTHLGELANSTNEAVTFDNTVSSNRLQPSHGHSRTLDANLEKRSSEALRDRSRTAHQEEVARDAALLGKARPSSNTGGARNTANADTNHAHSLKDATAYLQSSAFLQSVFEVLRTEAGHLHSTVDGLSASAFGFIVSGALLSAILGCYCLQSTVLENTPSFEAEDRKQYSYNGRVIYEWSQTSSTIILYTTLPKGIKQSDVEVKIWPKHLKIAVYGKQPFIKEELFGYVDVSRSQWYISWQGELQIRLQKQVADMRWPCVIQAHNGNNDDVIG
mmetsp:Transcript_49479/g.78306  ORF Transcript_49479/g.78306 Transcript_49479/m.78306 type:complete len:305 (+) Transcript_49479:63-977(+)